MIEHLTRAAKALVLGIGGGGDVVGALAVGRLCESLGTPFALGGVAWERMPIDPHPGPRPLQDIRGGRRLGNGAVLVDPNQGATTPEGVPFSESRIASFLGAPTALIDVSRGSAVAAEGVLAAAQELGCDAAVYVDVGGDVLARGGEPGLASPLCDAIMLAAACRAAPDLPAVLAVVGPGCDGELTAEEVLERVAALARAGGWLGTASVTRRSAEEIFEAAEVAVTEASLRWPDARAARWGRATFAGGGARCASARSGRFVCSSTPSSRSVTGRRWRAPWMARGTWRPPAPRSPPLGCGRSSTTSAARRAKAPRH